MGGWRAVYWFVTGTLLGTGLASLPSIGTFLLPLGLILVIFGAIRLGARGLWALPIGFGALPAILVHNTIVFAENQPNSGPIPASFYLLQWGFLLIAAVGVVWALVQAVVEWRRGALN
jgi:hypothetical protein